MLEWLEGWVIVDAIAGAIRITPYALLFLLGCLLTQGVLAANAAVTVGNAEAARQMLHGAFLDSMGIGWTLGIACGLVAIKAAFHLGQRGEARRRRS